MTQDFYIHFSENAFKRIKDGADWQALLASVAEQFKISTDEVRAELLAYRKNPTGEMFHFGKGPEYIGGTLASYFEVFEFKE